MKRERSRKGNSAVTVFTLSVEGLFLLGFLLLVVFGAGVYREAVEVQADNRRDRALLSYFTARAGSADSQGAVRLYEEDFGQVLSFGDVDSGYAVRIYQQGGKLLEDYGQEGSPLAPASAMVIGETETFSVREEKNGVYIVSTDAGEAVFTLKAGGGHEG